MVEEAGVAVAPTRPLSTYSMYSENQAQPFMFNDDDALRQQSPRWKCPQFQDAPLATLCTGFVDLISLRLITVLLVASLVS
jgi:hypothetical protein